MSPVDKPNILQLMSYLLLLYWIRLYYTISYYVRYFTAPLTAINSSPLISLSVPTSFTTFFTQVYCLVTPFIAFLNILLPHYTLDWFSTTGFTALHRSFYCLIVYVLIAALLIKTFSMLCYSYTSKEVKRLESNLFTCFNISTLHHLLTKTFTVSINLSFFSTPFNPFYILNAFFISYCFQHYLLLFETIYYFPSPFLRSQRLYSLLFHYLSISFATFWQLL